MTFWLLCHNSQPYIAVSRFHKRKMCSNGWYKEKLKFIRRFWTCIDFELFSKCLILPLGIATIPLISVFQYIFFIHKRYI